MCYAEPKASSSKVPISAGGRHGCHTTNLLDIIYTLKADKENKKLCSTTDLELFRSAGADRAIKVKGNELERLITAPIINDLILYFCCRHQFNNDNNHIFFLHPHPHFDPFINTTPLFPVHLHFDVLFNNFLSCQHLLSI